MKEFRVIAIASLDDKGLEGEVSGHFGRCPFYTLALTREGFVSDAKVVPNPHYANHVPGQMPKFIQSLGADVILAGGMGPRAIRMFEDFGVEVVTGTLGTVGKVLDVYLAGQLTGIVPCQHDHAESCGAHGTHQQGEHDHA